MSRERMGAFLKAVREDTEHDELYRLICEECDVPYVNGTTPYAEPHHTHLIICDIIRDVYMACARYRNPGKVEEDIEDARQKILEAVKAIEALDGWVRAMARQKADGATSADRDKKALEIISLNLSAEETSLRLHEEFKPPPREEWADIAALREMKRFRDGLAYPVEMIIPAVPQGRGRRKDVRAHGVAIALARGYVHLTLKEPRFRNEGQTPYGRLVAGAFRILEIKTGVRMPAEAGAKAYKRSTGTNSKKIPN